MVDKRHRLGPATRWAAALAGSMLLACVREPVEDVCPAVGPGDLVITEIRGDQDGPDTWGEWIEVFNATTETLDLRGLRVRMYRLNGGNEINALLREYEVPVDPQGYAVIGHHDPARLPTFVDATMFTDFSGTSSSTGLPQPRSLYPDAVIELHACNVEIDRIFYRGLPKTGTLALDGSTKPSADDNDDAERWCNDRSEAPADGPQTQLGIPGTPGEANPPCP